MFNFPDRTPQRENFLGAIFFGHDGVFPGRMKFYFPDPTPQRENFLGAILLGHDGVFPGWMKFYFSVPIPNAIISLVLFFWSRRRILWTDYI